MGEREFAIRSLDRDSKALRRVRQALSRITNGSYGVCLHREEDIVPKRPATVPSAEFCIKCQEMMDRNEIELNDPAELLNYWRLRPDLLPRATRLRRRRQVVKCSSGQRLQTGLGGAGGNPGVGSGTRRAGRPDSKAASLIDMRCE
jgi:hypothetical protein